LFGVTHLDIVRASTFVSSVLGKPTEADKYKIPVVGGHSGVTILPLLTQSKPSIVSYQGLVILRQIADGQPSDVLGNKEKRDALINRIQFGGDEVVKAKGKLLNPRKSS
jgi:malate dehydrogenase